MIEPPAFESLRQLAFDATARAARNVFAVLDGCMVAQLPEKLRQADCESSCLFSGTLDPMLEAAAPQLVELRGDSRFAASVLREGWNDHWGIVLHTDAGTDLYALRAHLRRYLSVSGPDGHPMYFRFYDPRSFRLVIPTFDAATRRQFFGPVRGALVEGETPDTALYFERGTPEPRTQRLGQEVRA